VPQPQVDREAVMVDRRGLVTVVTIDRPEVRNAVDGPTADLLRQAFEDFDADGEAAVAVLTGADGTFCAGADLNGMLDGRGNDVSADMTVPGPMGPTRMNLSKPVIAAVEGFAVAGGIELAAWCDLRVAGDDAVFGVYCRRWGVPLIDGGTVRLPRLIGHSHAMDLILTGRGVSGDEARMMGLVNVLTPPGEALDAAIELATRVAGFPQTCLRNDRRSAIEQWGLTFDEAMAHETDFGMDTIASPELGEGVRRFVSGAGRGGSIDG
jgi:enoyl-CoA hydratase